MSEEEKTQLPNGDTHEGNQPAETNPVERAEQILKGLAAENDRSAKILSEFKELEARRMLGGETNAGRNNEKPREETPQEYAKRIEEGRL